MTIIIRCADPRINETFENLAKNQEDGYAVISNTGSIRFFMDEHLDDLVGQVNILSRLYPVNKVILTNHTECAYYQRMGKDSREEYIKDLNFLKERLEKALKGIVVECGLVETQTGAIESC